MSAAKKCGCFSGLSDKQAVLVELGGMLEMFTWKVAQARSTFITSSPADKAAADYLQKVERGLEKLKEWTTKNAWRPETQGVE